MKSRITNARCYQRTTDADFMETRCAMSVDEPSTGTSQLKGGTHESVCRMTRPRKCGPVTGVIRGTPLRGPHCTEMA